MRRSEQLRCQAFSFEGCSGVAGCVAGIINTFTEMIMHMRQNGILGVWIGIKVIPWPGTTWLLNLPLLATHGMEYRFPDFGIWMIFHIYGEDEI